MFRKDLGRESDRKNVKHASGRFHFHGRTLEVGCVNIPPGEFRRRNVVVCWGSGGGDDDDVARATRCSRARIEARFGCSGT